MPESTPNAATTFQWLVERGQPENHEPTVWLENSAEHPASHRRWTTDAWSAAMFPTRETAEAYIAEEHLEAQAVEHGFMRREEQDDATRCLAAITLALEAHVTQGTRPNEEQMASMVAAAQAAIKGNSDA